MKKIGLLAFVLSAISNVSNAQFYLKAGIGYAFAQAGQTIDGTATPYSGTLTINTTNSSLSYAIKSASYSAGVQGAFGFGYLFTGHIGVQLDANIGIASHKYSFTESNVNIGSGILGNVSYVQKAKTPVILSPSVVLQTGGSVWNIYSRFGLALPLSTRISQDEIVSNAAGTGALTINDFNFQIKNSFSLGFTAALGVQYKLNDKFSVWGEASLLSMSAFIKQADLESWKQNGQSVPLSYFAPYPTTIKYSKNVTVDSGITNASQPAFSQPFSNVGINVGINIRLSEQRRHTHNNPMDNNDKNFKRKKF